MKSKINLSIVIPAFNEEENIGKTLKGLKEYLAKLDLDHEIIVINDASIDRTSQILNRISDIKIINHPYNKGYGASLKTGSRAAQNDYLLFFDGDSQHKPENIEKLIRYLPEYDMVVGARKGYQGPASRQPGKKILTWLANYLVGKKIPDINSGFRLVKKDLFLKFTHILPNSFSASTTITLAFYKDALNIKFVPITINKRKGESKVKIRHGLSTLLLILRVIMLFNPLKIFIPISLFLLIFGILFSLFGIIYYGRMPSSGILIILSGIILFFNALLADQLSALRRERK